ncbi:MAG: hypothetical protein KBS57_00805 [Alistipes sp.]|nr:hypothetical protein [Candidatus Minthomonas equi]
MKRIVLLSGILFSVTALQAHDFNIVNPSEEEVDAIYLLKSYAPFSFDKGKTVLFDIDYLRGKNVGYGNGDRVREWGKKFSKGFKNVL